MDISRVNAAIFAMLLIPPKLSGETPVAPKVSMAMKEPFSEVWGASGGLHKGRSSKHLLHMFYVALVCSSRVGSTVHLTCFLNLYPKQVGLTAGENHIFWVLNRLSTIHKKEKQWALQPCLPALPLVVTLPLARLSAWPLLTCGAFNKEREGSNFILSMQVIHVLKGDKNVIRKFSCQMCGKWNQFINAVKPMCEIGIKGEVQSHPCACCGRMCARQRALVLGKGMLLLWPHTPAANKHSKFSSAQMHFKVVGWEMPRHKEQTLIKVLLETCKTLSGHLWKCFYSFHSSGLPIRLGLLFILLCVKQSQCSLCLQRHETKSVPGSRIFLTWNEVHTSKAWVWSQEAPDMALAFIVMNFTWDDNEGDHMLMKCLSRCCTLDKSKVKEVYKVTLERSRVLCCGVLKLKRSVTLPASP